ncbi:MAG: DUF2945 domain-containing protein [Thermoplasmatota archaeon]
MAPPTHRPSRVRRKAPHATKAPTFRRGDHVEWNSEAGRVRGTILKKVTQEREFRGRVRHASRAEPQYVIQSDRTDHVAMHKGAALRKV